MPRHPSYDLILEAMEDTSKTIWLWNASVQEWAPISFEVLAAHRLSPNPGEGARRDIVIGEKPVAPPKPTTPALLSDVWRQRLRDFVIAVNTEAGDYDDANTQARANAISGLARQTDEGLIEIVMLLPIGRTIVASFTELAHARGLDAPTITNELLQALSSKAAVRIAQDLLDHDPLDDAVEEFVEAVSEALSGRGLPNPYLTLLPQAPRLANRS